MNMKTVGVIGQVRVALKNPVALVLGALLGGFVPVATYFVAHGEAQGFSLATVLVLGGLVYSAKTVWAWGRLAFGCVWKATGFVLLVEGVMVTSKTPGLAVAALCYLVAINAIATGCLLALKDAPPEVAKKSAKKAPKSVGLNSKTLRAPRPVREESGEYALESLAG
jgi:uncharacterized membrane protein (UPF0136 family)